MRNHASSNASFALEALPYSLSFPDVPGSLETNDDVESPLVGRKSTSASLTWPADAADLFILLCSFLLTATSIAFVILVFHIQGANPRRNPIPSDFLFTLQRVISSLTVTITSAVIMVTGKRYVLFKLVRGGLQSRRMAVYSNPSIGVLASYLVFRGAEFPLLGLSAIWGLALATSLTVDNSWGLEPLSVSMDIAVPFGPFDVPPGTSWVVPASEQLTFLMSSLCLGIENSVGLINVTSANIATKDPVGIIYYPPLPHSVQNIGFSFLAKMNGFNISMEHISSVPSTAQSLRSCANSTINPIPLDLWFDGSDTKSLSIIASQSLDIDANTVRLNATAIVMGGILSSTGNYTEFSRNGSSWPTAMPADSPWAQDIASLICNTTVPSVGSCEGETTTLSDFADMLNGDQGTRAVPEDVRWSTVLNTVLGAYSSAMFPSIGSLESGVSAVQYGHRFMPRYGVYFLISHIVMSLVVLVIAIRLRLSSHLGGDFTNSTRLLLDPLKKPELFNASLEATVDALGDPCMFVREDSTFSLVERKTVSKKRKWDAFTLRNMFDKT